LTSILERAGRWFVESGIQEADGGVARYYRSDLRKNAPVSTEITGYAVSALVFLYERTGAPEYRDAALRAACYLTRSAWDDSSFTFPFEPKSDRSYFFDTGIIIRGLMSARRISEEEDFRYQVRQAGLSLAFDFLTLTDEFAPVISLPEKQPLPYEARWSRSPGCYQLKSALAWMEMDDQYARRLFEFVLASALRTHESFLVSESDEEKRMDRLHAYSYFLEALLAVSDREEIRKALIWGIDHAAGLLREIAPRFERSDVSAQLLRVRLVAHHSGAVQLDESAAAEEASRTASFEDATGGFWFGRKGSEMLPFLNPVSTAFAMQALALWQDHQKGEWNFTLPQLI
jgi:hypothetical protein